jgi:predicted metal-dependent peptidase
MTTAHGRLSHSVSPVDARADAEEIAEIARSRVERARIDILLEHPYFAAALLAIPLRGTSEAAIAQALVTDGSRIVYRYDLVAALERPKVRRLIMHALAHVLLRHPDRGGSRDWSLWTVACDVAVELLFDQLGMKSDENVRKLRIFADDSAERIYERLHEEAEAARSAPRFPPLPRPACSDDGMLPGARDRSDTEALDDMSRSRLEDDSRAREEIDRATAGAEAPSGTELKHLSHEFLRDIEGKPKRRGRAGPGSGKAELDAAAREQVCWRRVLARFMLEPIDREWSFARPNRKHIWRGLYLPGPIDVEGGRFVVAIDTSGSMSDEILRVMLGEIDAIRRLCACELTVLQFDAAIHATAEFSASCAEDARIGSTKVMRVFGRGGTDLRLPFRWAEEELRNGRRISALIVCTDGYGPLPQGTPRGLPVLFLLPEAHAAPEFGEKLVVSTLPRGTG